MMTDTLRKSLNDPLKKDDRLIYVGPSGQRYSAVVMRAHRDGKLTVKIGYPLDETGEATGFYQGDLRHVGDDNIEYTWSR